MAKETYKTNPEIDIKNRRELNIQMKNLATYKKMRGIKAPDNPDEYEATQEINPITGKKYYHRNQTGFLLDFNPNLNLMDVFNSDKKYKKDSFYERDSFSPKKKPTTNDFIEYQFALAGMDVADGKMSEETYLKNRKKVKDLISKMNEAEIPISLISSPEGLNSALNEIEAKEKEKDYLRGTFIKECGLQKEYFTPFIKKNKDTSTNYIIN